MNTDGTGFHTCKERHKTESLWNHTTTDHKEGEQLEDRRSVGASSCYCGDGTDQRVQSLFFMIIVTITIILFIIIIHFWVRYIRFKEFFFFQHWAISFYSCHVVLPRYSDLPASPDHPYLHIFRMTERPLRLFDVLSTFSELFYFYCEAPGDTVGWGTALHPEGLGFDSRWCHWSFSLT